MGEKGGLTGCRIRGGIEGKRFTVGEGIGTERRVGFLTTAKGAVGGLVMCCTPALSRAKRLGRGFVFAPALGEFSGFGDPLSRGWSRDVVEQRTAVVMLDVSWRYE